MSLSDLSDLTDISSEEDDVPLAKSTLKPKKNAKSREYQITNTLRPPRTTQYTARSLYDQIIENTIDLDPEYQRDVVWNEQKQSGIIDSILRNYYIPPVIFAVSSSDDGSETRTCIDGKQRLTSIQRFMDGLIPHKDSFTNQKMWFKQLGNSKRKLLPKAYMQQFSNKQIVCVEYETLTDDQEREIFQRVQLGVALTPAERMQAITGPFPSLIRDLQNEVESGLEGHLEWATGRGRGFQCLASAVYLIDKSPKKTFPGPVQLERWLQETDPVPSQFKNNTFDTFRVLIEVVQAFGEVFRKPKLAPVEFVMAGLLVHAYKTKLSVTQLSSAINKMRADVRSKHQDIRLNSKVNKSMFEFMAKKVKASELKSDMQGDKPATSKGRIPQTSTAVKRKRKVESDEESTESESRPSKSVPSRSNRVSSTSKVPVTKAPARRMSTSAHLKFSTSIPAGPSKPSPTIKSSMPRISKVTSEAPVVASPQVTVPPSAQRKPSIPPVRRPPSPTEKPPVKREPSLPPTPTAPGPIDRLGPIRAAKAVASTSTHSRTASGNFQNVLNGVHPNGNSQPVHDPRRPPPQIQTNLDNSSQQKQAPWSAAQSPIVGTPSFPPGTPLDQNHFQMLLARAGLAQQQNQPTLQGQDLHQQGAPSSLVAQQPLNGPFSGSFSTSTPPTAPHTPTFMQNMNNPLHSQSASGSLLNGHASILPFAQGPSTSPLNPGSSLQAMQAKRNSITGAVNRLTSTASPPPHSASSIPPPPSSTSSAASGLPHPPTSASSISSTSWYNPQDQTRSGEGRRRSDSNTRYDNARYDRDYYPRSRDRSRDSRDYDSGRGASRDRGYGGTKYRERGRSRERDSGWGSRARGRGGSPSNHRYSSR